MVKKKSEHFKPLLGQPSSASMEDIHKQFLFMIIVSVLAQIRAVDFVFNGFDHSSLLMYDNATIEEESSHKILSLTQNKQFSIGRALYPAKIPTNSSPSIQFYTSFIFSMAPYKNILPGHGLVFIFTPKTGIEGTSSAQNLGLFNRTNDGDHSNRVFGVEFDVFMNEEFDDLDDNHVGIDINSLTSNVSQTAGYWRDESGESSFVKVKLNDGENYQVWIDYFKLVVNVTMVKMGMKRPLRPLLSARIDLSRVFEDEMYVGFTSSTGRLVESHKILAWSFSNSNASIGGALVTTGLPSFRIQSDGFLKSKGFILGITLIVLFVVACCVLIALCLVKRSRRKGDHEEGMEEWEMEYWPHRLGFQDIELATNKFDEQNLIGFGGNGKVYKGILKGSEIAVKRISRQNGDGTREFIAEISSLGRLKHRNLVSLRGWCKGEKGGFILVYDYMDNGSLDKWIFRTENPAMWISLNDRVRILRDVASGLLYLHEGWESKVLHRDIKASNVLLDKDMSGKLGDFGLARLHGRDQVPTTTQVVGTAGYLAPEVVRTGRVSTEADVYSYGVLVLEVVCGRRPIEDSKAGLVEWVGGLAAQGELIDALDDTLRDSNEVDLVEAERVLRLGLLCVCSDPKARPRMGQVVKILERNMEESCGEECGESMEEHLLGRVREGGLWGNAKYPQGLGQGSGHTNLDEIRVRMYSSASISWSDVLVEGR